MEQKAVKKPNGLNGKSVTKEKKPKINKKALIISIISGVLAIIIGISAFLVIDYIHVDTPYDSLIKLPKYIEVSTYKKRELSKSEVQSEFDDSKAALIAKFTEKNAVTGDILIAEKMNVTVKIEAYFEGEKKKNASYDSYEIADIGNHEAAKDKEFFEALEAHILGKRYVSDSNGYNNKVPDLIYTYPDDASETEVKGKTVTHKIQILSVTETIEPEYNDEFFVMNKDAINEYLGLTMDFKTVEAFETYMREQVQLNVLWNSIVDSSKVKKYPKKYIKKYEEEFDSYYEAYMEANDLTKAQLLSYLGTDEDGYNEKRTEYAEGIVKEELILYEIVKANKIRLSSDEYKKRATALAKDGGYGETYEDFEDAVGKSVAERTALWEKVKEWLLENAVWVA